jgi:RNA recognition motif-containing protein
MKLYVGNLSFETSEADLQDIFEQFGAVREIRVINDRETGRSRGFAFVTMGNDAEGRAAIATLHGKQFAGRTLTVNEARPKEERPRDERPRRPVSQSRR